MVAKEQKEFKNNGLLKKLIIANILLALLVSLLNFLRGEQSLAFLWFMTSIIWCLGCFLHTKFPFCKITAEEIIFPAPISKFSKRIKWGAIKEIKRINRYRIKLIIINKKNFKIDLLYSIKKDEIEGFIQAINQYVREK